MHRLIKTRYTFGIVGYRRSSLLRDIAAWLLGPAP